MRPLKICRPLSYLCLHTVHIQMAQWVIQKKRGNEIMDTAQGTLPDIDWKDYIRLSVCGILGIAVALLVFPQLSVGLQSTGMSPLESVGYTALFVLLVFVLRLVVPLREPTIVYAYCKTEFTIHCNKLPYSWPQWGKRAIISCSSLLLVYYGSGMILASGNAAFASIWRGIFPPWLQVLVLVVLGVLCYVRFWETRYQVTVPENGLYELDEKYYSAGSTVEVKPGQQVHGVPLRLEIPLEMNYKLKDDRFSQRSTAKAVLTTVARVKLEPLTPLKGSETPPPSAYWIRKRLESHLYLNVVEQGSFDDLVIHKIVGNLETTFEENGFMVVWIGDDKFHLTINYSF